MCIGTSIDGEQGEEKGSAWCNEPWTPSDDSMRDRHMLSALHVVVVSRHSSSAWHGCMRPKLQPATSPVRRPSGPCMFVVCLISARVAFSSQRVARGGSCQGTLQPQVWVTVTVTDWPSTARNAMNGPPHSCGIFVWRHNKQLPTFGIRQQLWAMLNCSGPDARCQMQYSILKGPKQRSRRLNLPIPATHQEPRPPPYL